MAIKGVSAEIRVASDQSGLATASALSGVTSFEFTKDPRTDAVEHLGSRYPYDIVGGPFEVTGTLERAYDPSDTTFADAEDNDSWIWIGYYPEGYEAGKRKVEIEIKVARRNISVGSPNDIQTERIEFIGRQIVEGTI